MGTYTMPPETDRLCVRHRTKPRSLPFTQLVDIIITLYLNTYDGA